MLFHGHGHDRDSFSGVKNKNFFSINFSDNFIHSFLLLSHRYLQLFKEQEKKQIPKYCKTFVYIGTTLSNSVIISWLNIDL